MWGMTNVNRVYPCHSCLKCNEIHNGSSAGTWACDFTDCHMPITFDLSTLFPLVVMGKVYLIKMCLVCLLSMLSCCNDFAFHSQQVEILMPNTRMGRLPL